MNIVAESRVLNLQFWVCADGGYGVSETQHIPESTLYACTAQTQQINFTTQPDLLTGLAQIRLRPAEANRLNGETKILNTDMGS